jgi:hypothetical protein
MTAYEEERRPMDGAKDDLFLRTFFDRVPADVAATFTPRQLDAIRLAYGARTPGAHLVDLRFNVPLPWRSYYFVLLFGRNRRTFDRLTMERLFRPLWTMANILVLVALLLMAAGAGFSVLYVTKRALGIDVFPGIDMLPDRTIERLLR